MYKFNNVDHQPTLISQQTQADQNQNTYSSQKTQVASNDKTNLDFDHLGFPMSMDPQSFNDLISFSKTPQLFELDALSQTDNWSCSPTFYPSPVVSTSYGMLIPMDSEQQILQHAFLPTELSNYVRIPGPYIR